MVSSEAKAKVSEILKQLSQQNLKLFQKVIAAEEEKLHMGRPHGILDDLESVVREVVK